MMKTILLATAALLAVPAAATAQYNNQRFLLGPGTYAARALCPPTLNFSAWSDATSWSLLGPPNQVCVNGRIGITFIVPPGPSLNIMLTLGDDPILRNPKIAINPDCTEGVETTCTTKHVLGQPTATAIGVFTYPGDVDWILLPNDHFYSTIQFTTKPKCYASGRVAIGPEGQQFLVALGGPAGCAYQITATARPALPYDN